MLPLLDRLKRRFSPTRILRTREGVQVLRPGGSAREWLVARSLCLYALVDCAQVPVNRRVGYVEIVVRRLAPFADPGYHVAWGAGEAMVWIWSRDSLADPAAPEEIGSDADRALPESVFLGNPEDAGESLIAGSDGVEGRIWRSHVLLASAWWPAPPSLTEWNRFLRGAGRERVAIVPEAPALPRRATPWASYNRRSLEDLGRRYQSPLRLVATAALAALVAWQIGGVLPLLWQKLATARQTQALQVELQPILSAREAAERDHGEIRQMLALRPPAGQVELMATVTRLVPVRTWSLAQWKYGDRDRLEVVIQTPQPDPQKLVQALETSGRFIDAGSEPADGADRIRLRARVLAAAEASP